MRFFVSGPRMFGGLVRPGVIFGANDIRKLMSSPGGANAPAINGSFVYVIEGEHGHVKIGVSTKPSDRLATLRTASPFPLNFAFVGVTPGDGYDIEAAAHEMLAGRRLNGEWFDATAAMAVAAVQSAAFQIKQKLLPIEPDQADEILRVARAQAAGESRPASAITLRRLLIFVAVLWAVLFFAVRKYFP